MTTNEVRQALKNRPFLPFTVHMADGAKTDVKSPEFAMLTPGGRILVVATEEDAAEMIDLLLVTKLSFRNRSSRPNRG